MPGTGGGRTIQAGVIMEKLNRSIQPREKGAVLIISMIFLAIFSALAVSFCAFSGTAVQLPANQHKANGALSSAESGLDILRYHISNITVGGDVSQENRLSAVAGNLASNLSDAGISNISISYDSSDNRILVSNVTIDSVSNKNFSAVISYGDSYDELAVEVTGSSGQFNRKIGVEYGFEAIGSSVFDFGVASRGPLQMSGQTEIDGVNLAIEASVYIEGNNVAGDAFSITNQASVAGNVTIANEYATYTVGNESSIGGATGEAADENITLGADYIDFPVPQPEYFEAFATGDVIDSSTNWDNYAQLNNVVIVANTNPTFASNVTINGILFIETPNTVSFAGKAVVNGIIVGDGDLIGEPDSSIEFSGQVVCNDISVLEGAEFDAIKQETGTFIVAPGFSLDFSGQALSMSGAIAASGISFSGQAGGVINGSLINYSDHPIIMGGQSGLYFNRSGVTAVPSGFVPNQTLVFRPGSYTQMLL